MQPFTDKRPWGNFRQFTHNEISTVKTLEVKANEAFSLQYHDNRKEFWLVLEGNPIITLGEETIQAKAGDEFIVEPKMKHRINGGETGAKVLEIALGDFDEDDIVRLEDKYGRN